MSEQPAERLAAGLPNFLVIGAMKCGTTSLYEYLSRHPQVFMSGIKELHYFAKQINWGRGVDWYRRQFDGVNGAMAVGEASTSYSKYPDIGGVPKRIAKLIPDMRFIYIIRDPIDRIRSQYLHEFLMGEDDQPFDTAVRGHSRYLNYSRYFLQLQQYLEWFDRKRVLVITSESLRDFRRETLRKVFGFLRVDDRWADPIWDEEFHRTSEKRVARPRLRRLYGVRAYQTVSSFVPEGMKDLVRPFTRWGTSVDRAVVTPDLRAYLEDALHEDAVGLRSLLGPGFDPWGLV